MADKQDLVTVFFAHLDNWLDTRDAIEDRASPVTKAARIQAENALRDILNEVTGAEPDDDEDEEPRETPDELRARVKRLKGE